MGSTNFTPHYDIPLPLGSDKTTPMDYNTSMQAVDTALFEAQGDASDAKQGVTALTQNLAQTNDNVSALAGRVTTAEGTITSQGTAITNLGTRVDGVEADAQDMICAYKEASATASRNYAIGDYFIYNDVLYRATQAINSGNTIVPDTNCTTTNVTSEIKNVSVDLSAYQTKQDNALQTTSKQVVGAINEINSAKADVYDTDTNPLANMNAIVKRTGTITCLYLSAPKSAMTQNVAYNCGTLPSAFRPSSSYVSEQLFNGRKFGITITNTGEVTVTAEDPLPSSGIPAIDGYLTYFSQNL